MADHVLIYLDPREGEKRFNLEIDRVYRIGTKQDNDIVVDRKDVSRHHAMLRVHDNWFHVTDLKSKNGTFINGTRISEAEIKCGDELCLSSARFVVLESSASSESESLSDPNLELEESVRRSSGSGAEDTQKFRGEASLSDLVTLVESTSTATRRGTLEEPLQWGIDRLGIEGAMILYREAENRVAMVVSSGEMGPLVSDHRILAELAESCRSDSDGAPHLRQDEVMGEAVLVAAIGHTDHVLVMRCSGSPPAVGDLRALLAATEIVLRSAEPSLAPVRSSWRGADSGSWAPEGDAGVAEPPDLEELITYRLEDARAQFESWMVSRVLMESGGNMSLAAERMGISRQGLFKKMKKLGIKR